MFEHSATVYMEMVFESNSESIVKKTALGPTNELLINIPQDTIKLCLRAEKGIMAIVCNLETVCGGNEKGPYDITGDMIGDFYLLENEKPITLHLNNQNVSAIKLNILPIEEVQFRDLLHSLLLYFKENNPQALMKKLTDNEERARVERLDANVELLSQRDRLNQIIVNYRELSEAQQQALNEGLFAKLGRGIKISAHNAFAGPGKKARECPDEEKTSEREYIRQIRQIADWGTGKEYIEKSLNPVNSNEADIRAIAFYWPDLFEGGGESRNGSNATAGWTNIVSAMPAFVGHYQPRLPGELGFYDPGAYETIKRQMETARRYGIYGFCIFCPPLKGSQDAFKPPLDIILQNRDLDLPFCICLDYRNSANTTEQTFNMDAALESAKKILPVLTDNRYLKLNGKPLLAVYEPEKLPHTAQTANVWREYFRQNGAGEVNLFFVKTSQNIYENIADAYIESPLHNTDLQGYRPMREDAVRFVSKFDGRLYDYSDISKKKYYLMQPAYKLYKTVMLPFDDSAQNHSNAVIYHNASPDAYREWLRDIIQFAQENFANEDKAIFIDSWNGWNRGTQLEPDRRFGYAFLQSTADCLKSAQTKRIIYVSHDAFPHGAQLLSLHIIRQLKERFGYDVYVILRHGGELVLEFENYSKDIVQIGRDIENTPQLVSKIKSWRADKAICNTVVSGDVLALLADQGIRCVSLIHEMPDIIRQMDALESFGLIAQKAEKVVFPSAFVKEKDCTLIEMDPGKVVVRPQGLYKSNPYENDIKAARAEVRRELGLSGDAKIVLGVGIADRRKGIDLFAECAKKTEDAGISFVWVGNLETIEYQETLEMCEGAGLIRTKRIIFIPAVKDAGKYFAAADLFLLSSREDPFPSVVMEAMHVGVPVIAFEDCGGYTDIVGEQTGMLVPKENVGVLCDYINQHIHSKTLLAQKSEYCKRLIAEKFNFADYVRFLLNLLDENP